MNSSDANRPPDEASAALPPRWRQQKYRGLLWFSFWILFLTTPVLPFAAQFLPRLGLLRVFPNQQVLLAGGGLVAGIVVAGFILAKLYSNSTAQLMVKTLAFAFLIALVYGFIAFAGCMISLKGI